MRLVLQVGSQHGGVARIARGKGAPLIDPVVFGEPAGAVPEWRHEAVVCARVVVEDHPKPLTPGLGDDLVHHLLRGLALQRSVAPVAVVNARRRGALQRLKRERQADDVEPLRLDLGEHVAVVAGPQAVGRMVGGFKAKPVDALQHHFAVRLINDLATAGVQRPLHTQGGPCGDQRACAGNGNEGTTGCAGDGHVSLLLGFAMVWR